jgi:FMN phosphatase YigB (HAD superfamily)
MIRGVIFDFGNVVRGASRSSREDIADAYNISRGEVDRAMTPFVEPFQKGLMTENKFWKKFSQALRKPIPQNKKSLWRAGREKTFYLYPEIIDFVKQLKRQGIKTAILSNTIKPHAEIAAKHYPVK